MGIVVQKYGGSSLADADAIKRVARRIVDIKKSGHDVVVVARHPAACSQLAPPRKITSAPRPFSVSSFMRSRIFSLL